MEISPAHISILVKCTSFNVHKQCQCNFHWMPILCNSLSQVLKFSNVLRSATFYARCFLSIGLVSVSSWRKIIWFGVKKMALVLQISYWNSHYRMFAMASSSQLKVQWWKKILFLLIEPNNNGHLTSTNNSPSPSALGNLSMLWSLSTVNRFVDGDCWYTICYFVSINVICADNEHDIPKWHWLNPEPKSKLCVSEKEDNKNRF